MRDASSEPGCSRDLEQPFPGGGFDGSRDALAGRPVMGRPGTGRSSGVARHCASALFEPKEPDEP